MSSDRASKSTTTVCFLLTIVCFLSMSQQRLNSRDHVELLCPGAAMGRVTCPLMRGTDRNAREALCTALHYLDEKSPSNPTKPAILNRWWYCFLESLEHQFQADVSLPSMHDPAS
mmetsp:Transcript_64690/g.127854  ORF Transcript_64690/g.127854 Transcript_64690/m.127854 type:complete len:115 (-) Transcript_64690:1021-1365(-)